MKNTVRSSVLTVDPSPDTSLICNSAATTSWTSNLVISSITDSVTDTPSIY